MICPECEALPTLFHGDNDFYLRAATHHTLGKLMDLARNQGLAAEPMDDPFCFQARAGQAELIDYLYAAATHLSREEQAQSRALALRAGQSPSMSDLLAARPLLQFIAYGRGQELVQLLEQDRHFSLLQPIFTADGRVYGQEALLRGRNGEGGVIPPAALFDMAADAGLLFALDLKARHSAINTMARRPRDGARLFVNFNPSSIYDPTYCLRSTREMVQQVGLTPADIVFEVTETARAHDEDHLRAILDYYREAGFQVALDDIGAGFSGLNLLQLLKPDFMKIDMALIRDIDSDPYKQIIVQHLIGIAHDSGAMVVAEGIETEAERAWVTDAGADLLQGYLLGRPVAVEQASAVMDGRIGQ